MIFESQVSMMTEHVPHPNTPTTKPVKKRLLSREWLEQYRRETSRKGEVSTDLPQAISQYLLLSCAFQHNVVVFDVSVDDTLVYICKAA
jgi:hypothetical protein